MTQFFTDQKKAIRRGWLILHIINYLFFLAGILILAFMSKKPYKGIIFGEAYCTLITFYFFHIYNKFYAKGINSLDKISYFFFIGPGLFFFTLAFAIKSWWMIPLALLIIPIFGLAGCSLTWSIEAMNTNDEKDPLRDSECYIKATKWFETADDLVDLSVKLIQFQKEGDCENEEAINLAYEMRKRVLVRKKYSWLIFKI